MPVSMFNDLVAQKYSSVPMLKLEMAGRYVANIERVEVETFELNFILHISEAKKCTEIHELFDSAFCSCSEAISSSRYLMAA